MVAAAAGPWGPLSPRKVHRPAAVIGTTLVHLLGVLPALLLITHEEPPSPPAEPAIDMVFAEVSHTQPNAPSPSVAETMSTSQPPVQATPTPAAAEQQQPVVPPLPDVVTSPERPALSPSPQVMPPSPPPALAEEAEPLPLPLPPGPPPPQRPQAAKQRNANATPTAKGPAAKAHVADTDATTSTTPATPPPKAAAPADTAWERALAAWLAAHRVYPEAARRRGIEGHVTLRFSIDQSGHVAAVTVLRGSGSPILDSAAEAMVRGAAVPAPPRSVLGQVTVSVQVDYVLAN